MVVKVSVVVPTYKRPQLLRRCLDALMNQKFEAGEYEIVVVDDGSSEETRQLVNSYRITQVIQHLNSQPVAESLDWAGGRYLPQAEAAAQWSSLTRSTPRVRYLTTGGRRGPAAARNQGWRAAVGEIIAFTDDDCVPDYEWLQNGVLALAGGAAGAWGRVVVPLPKTPTDYEKDTAGLERSEFITANCFYRRTILEAVGGFDERFCTAWREDSDLFFSILERNYPLTRAPFATVVHPVRPAPKWVSLGQQKRNIFNALLYKKHPELYRQRIQASPPWIYYAAVAALVTAVVGALTGGLQAAVGGGGVWAVLTLVILLRRLRQTSHRPGHIFEMLVTSALIPPLAVYWRLRGAWRYRVFFL